MNKERKSEEQFRRFCKYYYRFSTADIEKAVDFRQKETVRGLDKAIPSFVNAYILNNGNGKLIDSIKEKYYALWEVMIDMAFPKFMQDKYGIRIDT